MVDHGFPRTTTADLESDKDKDIESEIEIDLESESAFEIVFDIANRDR